MTRIRGIVLLASALLLLLPGCGKQPTLNRDKLASVIKTSVSVAADVELLSELRDRDITTRNFAEGHLEGLSKTLQQAKQELAIPAPAALENARTQVSAAMSALATEVENLQTRNDSAQWQASGTQIAEIKHRLQRLQEGL